MPNPDLIFYGARCTWWDSAELAARQGEPEIPCCPFCHRVLFQIENEGMWIADAAKYEADGHPNYVAVLKWGRGQCFPNMATLTRKFWDAQGAVVH